MGRSRLLPRGLIPLLLLAACGDGEDLLEAKDLSLVYSGGNGGKYRMDQGAPGRIVGKVRFEGVPWKPRELDLTTQDGFCVQGNAPGGLRSDDFLLGENGGLQDVIVYIKQGTSGGKWDPPTEAVVLDQVNCRYVPHVVVAQVGQPVVIKSSDRTTHNVHGARGANDEFNQVMSHPESLGAKYFRRPEIAKRVSCDVHGWMVSWLAVVPHPFHAVTGADGTFTIENVPPGVFQLAAWHEKPELAEQTTDVTVPPGGTVEVEFVFKR